MKQIAFVLFLTVLALGGFMLTRQFLEKEESRPTLGLPEGPGPQGNLQAPGQQRPQVEPGQVTVSASDELRETVQRRRSTDWRKFASAEHVVTPEQDWTFDLSSVDFEADPVFEQGNVSISRDEFRSFVCLELAGDLVHASLAVPYAMRMAAERGIDLTPLDQTGMDQLFAYFAGTKGHSPESAAAQLAAQHNMPVKLSRRLWDAAVRTSLGYFIGNDVALAQFAQSMPALENNQDATETTQVMLATLDEGWAQYAAARAAGEEPSVEALSKLLEPNNPLNLIHRRSRDLEVRRRTWTFMDQDLPPGVLGAVAVGEFPEGATTAPWLIEGDVIHLPVDELWGDLSENLNRSTLEDTLRSLVWMEACEVALEREGSLEPKERTWELYQELDAQYLNTIMTLAFEKVSLEGYPSMAHFRRIERLRRAHDAQLPEGWDSFENLEAYFESNRVFIEPWAPELEVALFPPIDPAKTVDVTDWDRALQQARDMRARVDAGEDFSTLRAAHNESVTIAWASLRSAQEANQFDATFRLGNLLGDAADLREFFQESTYGGLILGRTLVDLAMATMDTERVSQPVRTPVGYVLARVYNVRLRGLEGEFEDFEGVTRDRYRYGAFRVWANQQLVEQTR
ncbi:MAG: hypothetical protein ACYS26_13620 [Planctomycetota bacterium]|jgi:hypothetical protein